MNKKLTLSIDEDLIKFAHDFSENTNQSISHIVEDYLDELKKQEAKSKKTQFTSKVQNLYGAFNNKPIPDKKDLRRSFHEKNNN